MYGFPGLRYSSVQQKIVLATVRGVVEEGMTIRLLLVIDCLIMLGTANKLSTHS